MSFTLCFGNIPYDLLRSPFHLFRPLSPLGLSRFPFSFSPPPLYLLFFLLFFLSHLLFFCTLFILFHLSNYRFLSLSRSPLCFPLPSSLRLSGRFFLITHNYSHLIHSFHGSFHLPDWFAVLFVPPPYLNCFPLFLFNLIILTHHIYRTTHLPLLSPLPSLVASLFPFFFNLSRLPPCSSPPTCSPQAPSP